LGVLAWPRRHRWAAILAVVGLTGMVFLAVRSVGSASAASGIQLVDDQTGYCLDSNYSDPDLSAFGATLGAVYTDPCNGGPYQQWAITSNANGTVTLTDVQTGYCLDSNSLNPDVPATGRVYTDPCNGGVYQQWYVGPSAASGDRDWFFQDAATGLILDSNYSNPDDSAVGAVYTDPCNGGPYQQWGFINNSTPDIPVVRDGTPFATCS
jgi:hypothetical protein